MKKRHLLFSLCIVTAITPGCTTQKAMKETKRQFDNGEYGWAVYTGTVGVTMAALVDVFTLGGTSDVQTGYNTVSGIANPQQGGSTANAVNTSSLVQASSPAQPGQSAAQTGSTLRPVLSTPQTGSPLQSGTQTRPGGVKYNVVAGVNNCLVRDTKSNSLCDFLINRCGFPIEVKWVNGTDCRTGCGDGPISPGAKSSVTKTHGLTTHAVCPSSYSIRATPEINNTNTWTGQKDYFCVDVAMK